MRHALRKHLRAAIPCLLLLAGCSIHPQADDGVADPDLRLAGYLDDYERAQDAEGRQRLYQPDRHVLADPGLLRSRIERMCVEFPAHAPSYYANAVLAYFDDLDLDKADRYLAALLRIDPAHADGAMLRARILSRLGNVDGARRLLDEQRGLNPQHAGVRESLAMTMHLAGDPTGALSELEAAERLGAPPWRLHYNRGLIQETTGDLDRARAEYERCLADRPDFEPARDRLKGLRI